MSQIRKELFSGVLYTAIAKYSGVVISLVVSGVLARLLSPTEFGTVAVATVIITFFSIFSDLGIAPAIIQHKDLEIKDLNNIFSFTIWSGALLALCFFCCSWAIAAYYDSNILAKICQILSVNIFFAAINIVPNALLFKAKRFGFIAKRTLVVQSIAGTIAIVAASNGVGIYALLINPILSSISLFAINLYQYPQHLRLTLGLESLRKIFAFSAYQFLFNIINYLTRNLDKILIGKYMGMSPLGYYEKSYRLMMLPLQNITHVVSPVMHPIFADFQNDLQRLSTSYLKVVRFLAFIGFPLSVILFFSARELTLLIFGGQWEASVPVFRILALSVGVQIVLSTSGSIFQAANSTKVMFLSGLFSSILNVSGILAGIFFFGTLQAVAWCICVTFTINFVQAYILLYCVTFRLNMRPFWQQLISPMILTTICVGALWGLSVALPSLNMIVSLAIKGTLFLTIFALYIQLSGEYNIVAKARSFISKKQ